MGKIARSPIPAHADGENRALANPGAR